MSVENPKALIGSGHGEMPGGLPGNRTRAGLDIDSYGMRAHVESDGSGYLMIYHGGLNQKFNFNGRVRRDLIAGLGGTVE